MSASACFQCGLPVPLSRAVVADVDGAQRLFCCIGCRAVAQLIDNAGLRNYFRFRDNAVADTASIVAGNRDDFEQYDAEAWQKQFVCEESADIRSVNLIVEGIHCSACTWLIEKYLGAQQGVESVIVNSATHRCQLRWRARQTSLSQLLPYFIAIGYRPIAAAGDLIQQHANAENRQALMRLGVAGFGMMQVGMMAIALYAGALQDMTENWRQLLRWISAVVATPVVFYSARPFFSNAWRALRFATASFENMSMDVPVALAVGLAYGLSCWATISGDGEVYFDSVTMFTFFLLAGRYVEMRIRHKNELSLSRLESLLPVTAQRIKRAGELLKLPRQETVGIGQLSPGDWLQVREGQVIPCDGLVVEGASHVNEALLNGEPSPVGKAKGSRVIAGSFTIDGWLIVEAEKTGQQTQVAAIQRITDQALQEKPRQLAAADRVASYFVASVLLVAAVTGLYWYLVDPQRALWIVLSVLVVTCPCALSLATPAALAAALHRLRRLGLLVINAQSLQTLAKVTMVVFDKTGTLTQGNIAVTEVKTSEGYNRDQVLRIIAALEAGSSHPIAGAFAPYQGQLAATRVSYYRGEGVEGCIGDRRYRFGNTNFARAIIKSRMPSREPQRSPRSEAVLLLADASGAIAFVTVNDTLRPESNDVIASLKSRGLDLAMLSGDDPATVRQIASELDMLNHQGGLKPEQKMDWVKCQQTHGQCVAMVGDGLNDLPVLAAADVSVAMSTAADLTQVRADTVLLRDDLSIIPPAFRCASRCARIIRQNLSWALLYNVVALPLAIAGLVPPYAAAIGMSLSSLLVVANSARLARANLQWD